MSIGLDCCSRGWAARLQGAAISRLRGLSFEQWLEEVLGAVWEGSISGSKQAWIWTAFWLVHVGLEDWPFFHLFSGRLQLYCR